MVLPDSCCHIGGPSGVLDADGIQDFLPGGVVIHVEDHLSIISKDHQSYTRPAITSASTIVDVQTFHHVGDEVHNLAEVLFTDTSG